MKFNSLSLSLFTIVFSLFVFTSCAEKKSEKKLEKVEETVAAVEYQCPMDCEDGKTYHEAGSCPVCKMDLKAMDAKMSHSCNQHEDGNCSCEGDKCECVNCADHS